MRAIAKAASDVFDYGCDTRTPPNLRKENVAEEERGYRQRRQENADSALAVGESGSPGKGPDRKPGHERGHSRYPPFDAVSAFEKIRSHTHETHEERADPRH